MAERWYLRLRSDLPERKRAYTDGRFRAYVEVLCAANVQEKRGTFRNMIVLRGYLGRLSRHIPYLIEQRDLVAQADGSYYVEGWHEHNEGDLTAPERMRRLRERRRGVTPDVTAAVTPDVTVPNVTRRKGTSTGLDNSYVGAVTPSVDNGGSMMGFRPRAEPTDHPERRDPANPTHWGQHPNCMVCGAMPGGEAPTAAPQAPAETFEQFRERKAAERGAPAASDKSTRAAGAEGEDTPDE